MPKQKMDREKTKHLIHGIIVIETNGTNTPKRKKRYINNNECRQKTNHFYTVFGRKKNRSTEEGLIVMC